MMCVLNSITGPESPSTKEWRGLLNGIESTSKHNAIGVLGGVAAFGQARGAKTSDTDTIGIAGRVLMV